MSTEYGIFITLPNYTAHILVLFPHVMTYLRTSCTFFTITIISFTQQKLLNMCFLFPSIYQTCCISCQIRTDMSALCTQHCRVLPFAVHIIRRSDEKRQI